MACAAAQRDFHSSSLVALPLGLSFGFSPTSVCVPPSGICSLPRWEGVKEVADWDTLAHSGQGGVRWPRWAMHKAFVAAEIRRQLQQTGARLLWWESPSRAYGGRVWCVGVVLALPLVSLSTGTSFPRQTTLPLGIFLAMEPLTPVSSVLSEQPTVVISSDLLSTWELQHSVSTSTDLFSSPESFSTQPPPVVANSHPRRGTPGLIPKKALG